MRKLENWLQTYMVYSEHSEAPDAFHFWTGVSVLAGALRAKVWIDMGYFRWVPNFYIVFVAPPGIVSKSTTANIGMNLLRDVPGIHFGPDAVTWQSLVQSLGESTEGVELPDGTTIPMSAITIVSSEFGTFLNPNDRDMVDVLVSLWDGQVGVWEKHTKTSGSDRIANPWINIVACTTPAWIAGNFPEYMIGGGFTSRTIFVYADVKRCLIAYPADVMPEGQQKIRQDLVRDLEEISTNMVGEFQLTSAAKEWGVNWYEKHNDKVSGTDPNDRFAGYLARKQTHIHKLAMVVSASESDDLFITPEHLAFSDQMVSSSEHSMPNVFSQINAPEAKAANRIVDLVDRLGRIPLNQAFSVLFQSMSITEFEAGVAGAVKANRVYAQGQGNNVILISKEQYNGAQNTDAATS
jgi:hypothetical protein